LEGLILFFLAVIVDLLVFLLSWVNSSVQEGLEALSESLLPEELLVLILANELIRGDLDVLEVV
jgi:hypothetical protein